MFVHLLCVEIGDQETDIISLETKCTAEYLHWGVSFFLVDKHNIKISIR